MVRTTERSTKLTYRADIDGLRAVAVLLVVFNHLRTRVTGGYVGVDVFFVISGYLISSTILSDMQAGRFSVLGFYERRIRRIFPALLVMLLVASLMTYLFLLPSETVSFARSLVAALLSVSNMLFWSESSYFDAPSLLKPLLHTWSLAVEEQFYIVFPLFIVAIRRWLPARLKAAIWTVTAISFLMACMTVPHSPSAAFFFSPLRAWELLIGTVLSQCYLPAIKGVTGRNLASAAGLAAILVPGCLYTAQTPFPGLAALPACVGTALIIAAGETGGSVVGRVLAWRPVVFVGLISYSLYLWHWPMIVFRNRSLMLPDLGPLDGPAKLELLAGSLVVATLSWWLVETPFRKGRFRPGRTALFVVNGGAVAVAMAIGVWMIASHGLTWRFSPEAVSIADYATYHPVKEWREGTCFLTPGNAFSDFRAETCLKDVAGRRNVLLLGDSLAAHLYPGLAAVFPELNVEQANSAECRPFVTQPAVLPPYYGPNCAKMSAFLFGESLVHNHVDAVLLAASWQQEDLPELGRTIAWIQGHGMEAIVFGPVPEYDTALPRVLALSLRLNDPAIVSRHTLERPRELDKAMAALARDAWKVRYISAFADLCSGQVEMAAKAQPQSAGGCPVYAAPGVPLEFDDHHLTVDGSMMYAKAVRERGQLP